jgi:small-conductance mechanosensitive channel
MESVFHNSFSAMPDWMVGLFLLVAGCVVAFAIHWTILRILIRLIGTEHRYARSLILRTRGLTQLATIILVLSGAIQLTTFDPAATKVVSSGLVVAFVFLVGWTLATAVNLAGERYLARFKIGTDGDSLARKQVTQIRILTRAAITMITMVTVAIALMTFDSVRQFGVSLFASAGVAGIVAGLAARPILANLIAGLQIALTQPMRIEDAVVIEGEMGWIQEIGNTYVVVRLWDWRRLIVPLSYFIERPFQNWTRESGALIGSVFLHVDYSAPVDELRKYLESIVHESPLWDGQVVNLQVTDTTESTIKLRVLVSSRSSSQNWDLQCEVREKLIAFLRDRRPDALPRRRQQVIDGPRQVFARKEHAEHV